MAHPEPRRWIPKHPEKYMGDPTNIWARSSWEIRFLNWCDNNKAIIKYCSEEIVIPYRCPTDSRIHRYFVDFLIKVKTKNNEIKTFLIEVKPSNQVKPPKYPGKQTKRYITESMTFMKNQAKWEAATRYAEDRGWAFKVITEYELGLK